MMWNVEIYHRASGKVETRMGPMTERSADRVQRGAMINMNLLDWGCRIVPAETPHDRA